MGLNRIVNNYFQKWRVNNSFQKWFAFIGEAPGGGRGKSHPIGYLKVFNFPIENCKHFIYVPQNKNFAVPPQISINVFLILTL